MAPNDPLCAHAQISFEFGSMDRFRTFEELDDGVRWDLCTLLGVPGRCLSEFVYVYCVMNVCVCG